MNRLNAHKVATPLFLWGLAVSAVIVGEFSGWNAGLLQGGFGGMLVATFLVTLMFGCLSATLSELSTAMPFTGGAYAFARAAFGRRIGLLTGVSLILEYLFALATILAGIEIATNAILQVAFGFEVPPFIIWLAVLVVFVSLNIWDTKVFFKSALVLAIVPLLVLMTFWVNAIPQFDTSLLLSVIPSSSGTDWLPNGLIGIAWCLPFSVWFYLSLEVITLSPEDAVKPETNIPKGLYSAFWTLALAGILTLIFNSGIPPGAKVIGHENDPLLDGFLVLLGDSTPKWIPMVMVLSGALAGFHSTVYAAAKSVYALSRSGYLPSKLAKSSERRGTPYVAIIFVAGMVFFVMCIAQVFSNKESIVALLLNMSVLSAIICYSISFLSFIKLRVIAPGMKRPYSSPLGVTGAVTGLLVTGTTALLMFTNSGYRIGLMVCALIYAAALVVYSIYGKNKIDPTAPEEAFAEALALQTNADEEM